MDVNYVVLRLIRHFLPESVARFLVNRSWIIRPSLESSEPFAAVEQYINGLSNYDKSIKGKRVLVFDYGGRFAVGVELLRRAASHVLLCDHYVLMDSERNLELLANYPDYLFVEDNIVKPRSEFITLLHGDVRSEIIQKQISDVDYVLSTSVYEHLDDIENITHVLAKLSVLHDAHLHFVDLCDHYFRFPFEMLTISE